ncbi:serine--tRNA ligase [Mycoplasma suis]|uniref:Serine--tRNA ligase n=2 Tax=Mycoplasma suis TaxID=57372 RepID=F0QSB9_MYCSL|nr:serine--tRNA ligase [Mycoplasma suis]ADX98389.1 seryl-tRNA synthetase [Mycoplasma suis str. Illinois]CBZ40898.1 Seryl-tRNA synthetase [Mycoplasma suis KI3806]
MISLKWFRENFDELVSRYSGRHLEEGVLERIRELDIQTVQLNKELDSLRAEKNKLSENYDPSKSSSISEIKFKIVELEKDLLQKKGELHLLLSGLPAIPNEEIEQEDKLVKTWGEIPEGDFYKSYLELSSSLGLLDLELSAKITGTGYSVYVDRGEKLMRALISFTLDWAEKHGFKRYFLPSVVNKDSLFCTSQINKFEENLFQLNGDSKKFLSPTAEVQLTNLFKDMILTESDLPIKVCANTNCFRNEKIGAGVESRGIMRMFQFNKTEIVMISHPEKSEEAQDFMSKVIESLLEELNLPYRKIMLSRSEMSFASSKTYDFEVWIPSEKKYREISSLSNTRDFQSMRGKIRCKTNRLDPKEKSRYVHVLNGSCLAIDRLFIAVVENHQTAEGEIILPESLSKFLGFKKISKEGKN